MFQFDYLTGVLFVSITIGLLSDKNDLIDDFKLHCPAYYVNSYRSLDTIKKEEISIIVIDADYFETDDTVQFFLSKIRKKIQEIPVILIVTVSRLETLKVDWFFDDFMLYPFRKGELNARISRLINEKGLSEDVIVIGNLKIDLKEYTVYHNNEKMELTYKEFELFRLLVQNKGVVFSRKELLNKIWGVEYIGGTRTVDVHIRRLRGKLGDEFNSIIETVRNVGYRCME